MSACSVTPRAIFVCHHIVAQEAKVVSLRGHGGWSAGFQSHERAFSCTSIVNSCLRILSQECLSEVLPEVAYHFISFSLFSTTQRQHEVFPGVAYHFLSVSLYLTSRERLAVQTRLGHHQAQCVIETLL
ncbi:uncharacterized protein isoform X11 [Castor canadensis]|uniref:Uncharacterized protein isoform X11 n=1 Tax=Castor canadensis TaxID=51338 RepID=A0AC58LPN1_CASCN